MGLLALVSSKCSKREELLLATLGEELFDEMVVSSKFNPWDTGVVNFS